MKQKALDSTVNELPPLVPVKQTGTFLHAHPETVRSLVRSGELIGIQRRAKQGSPVLVTRDSIAAYLTRNQR
jgi:hypothetical protein